MLMCQSEGGSVGCGECQRYFNIKRDYCPVMCGLCDCEYLPLVTPMCKYTKFYFTYPVQTRAKDKNRTAVRR